MTTLIYVIQTIMYVGMVIYAPALALETVTGLDKSRLLRSLNIFPVK